MSKREAPRKTKPASIFRYASREHHDLIRKCAHDAGMSINDWIRQATLKVARREAAEAARLEAMRQAEI